MEHLNFCRNLTKQYASLADIPSFNATDRARMHHAMDLAAASQKFLLPDGGLLMDDPELRAIDGTETLRLPHKFIALEFLHADDEDRQDVLTKRIVFARERDEFIYLSGAGCATHDGFWAWMPECAIPINDYLDRSDPKGRVVVKFRPLAPKEVGPDCYPMYLKVLMCFLNALACSNVHVARSEPKRGVKKVKAALPFDTYHLLTIDVPGRASDRTGVSCLHRSPREHLRRGHIRRLADGRKTWVNATVVASGRGGGVVSKDYAIRCAA
jgi:hypothetical protein